MEENKDQQAPSMSPVDPEEEAQVGHTDKLVGVFSEPGNTFSNIARVGAKTSDWLIPVLILIAVSILSVVVYNTNPTIKGQMKLDRENQIQEQVEKGAITQEQADQQIEGMNRFMEGPFMIVTGAISSIIMVFIVFFVISGVYFLFVKFALKGVGTYKDAMVAYGLPYYIVVIQAILMVILSILLGKMVTSTSVAVFVDVEKASLMKFVLGKLDPISIWFYAVISIAFAKMFKSPSTGKYFVLIFGMWIGFGLIFFLLGRAVPFLSFLAQ